MLWRHSYYVHMLRTTYLMVEDTTAVRGRICLGSLLLVEGAVVGQRSRDGGSLC